MNCCQPRRRAGWVVVAALATGALCAGTVALGGVRPRYGGTALRGVVALPALLAPARAQTEAEREVARQIHGGLFRYGRDGQPEADLVERVEVAEPGRSVRLWLRPAWYHDGRPVTPEDARAAVERFVLAGGPGALLASGDGPVASLAGERAIDLRIDAAPDLWTWLLADLRAAVLPPAGDGRVGAGPFAIVAGAAEAGLKLRAWERHPRGRPLLDAVDYRAYADERALLLARRHQGADLIDQGAVSGDEVALLESRELVLLAVAASSTALGAPGAGAAALAAARIDALVHVVLRGAAEPAGGLLPLPVPPAEAEGAPAAPAARPNGVVLKLAYPAGAGLERVAGRLAVDLHAAGYATRLAALGDEGEREPGVDLRLVLVPGVGRPTPLVLAEAAARLGRPLPAALRRAARAPDAASACGSDCREAERAILGDSARVLLRRVRRVEARPTLRDLEIGPDGIVVLEDAWRWPPS